MYLKSNVCFEFTRKMAGVGCAISVQNCEHPAKNLAACDCVVNGSPDNPDLFVADFNFIDDRLDIRLAEGNVAGVNSP
ncbi:hypothetical protein JJB09_21485 [Rhizobium sp. KVB221]|uniref:Uncharacterized protein n=1 Tax=Rhizobium setariae TaxID=2801340 RepID=A0A937CQJ9_9HYPH|nr:hypothetical protein [Rhizobium setariae]MBL0374589.1 hypothetical protein [Rhizobium setariae]